MPSESGFLDEQGMVELARKAIEDLRKDGISPTELKRLENILKEGSVGEALMLSSLLKTIQDEISPDASQKKFLQIYQVLEECCRAFVELSRNLFDAEVWQHYRAAGYESFDLYCAEALGIPASKIQALKSIKDQSLPRPRKAGPSELFSWLFRITDLLADAKKRHDLWKG
jgi:hypothetical protein